MTTAEFAAAFPPRLYEAFPALALFNPMVRDVTLGQVRIMGMLYEEKPIGDILDYLASEAGVVYVAGAIFAYLTQIPDFGMA